MPPRLPRMNPMRPFGMGMAMNRTQIPHFPPRMPRHFPPYGPGFPRPPIPRFPPHGPMHFPPHGPMHFPPHGPMHFPPHGPQFFPPHGPQPRPFHLKPHPIFDYYGPRPQTSLRPHRFHPHPGRGIASFTHVQPRINFQRYRYNFPQSEEEEEYDINEADDQYDYIENDEQNQEENEPGYEDEEYEYESYETENPRMAMTNKSASTERRAYNIGQARPMFTRIYNKVIGRTPIN